MSRSSERRQSYIVIQTVIGLVVAATWLLVGLWVMEEELLPAALKVAPLFVIYELGVLSRYAPGVRQVARNLDGWTRARRRS